MHAVIIGAGITGALVAHELLLKGADVTVLEAREKGAGSSSRSAACIRQQWSTPATVRAMRYSVRAYDRFGEDFGCGPDVAPPVVHNGYLFLYADGWEEAQARVAMQHAAGLTEVEAIPAAALTDRFGRVDATNLKGATFCPTDGFLRPDIVYMEGFRRVEELGGRLIQNFRVMDGAHDGGRLVAVKADDGREVEGDVFVNATNAWAPRLSRRLGGIDLPIAPLKRYLYFVHRGGDVGADEMMDWPMTITPSRAYCRPENPEQLLAGWAHATDPEPEFDWSDQDLIEPPFFHKTGLDNYGFQLWMELAEAMPAIGEFKGIEATTAGFYAVTPDHNPILGFDPQQPGLLHAAGFSGHGAMLGPFTAKAIAAMALAGETLTSVRVEDEEIDVGAMLVGRDFTHAEGMVI